VQKCEGCEKRERGKWVPDREASEQQSRNCAALRNLVDKGRRIGYKAVSVLGGGGALAVMARIESRKRANPNQGNNLFPR
jgi:hypothetical protein